MIFCAAPQELDAGSVNVGRGQRSRTSSKLPHFAGVQLPGRTSPRLAHAADRGRFDQQIPEFRGENADGNTLNAISASSPSQQSLKDGIEQISYIPHASLMSASFRDLDTHRACCPQLPQLARRTQRAMCTAATRGCPVPGKSGRASSGREAPRASSCPSESRPERFSRLDRDCTAMSLSE